MLDQCKSENSRNSSELFAKYLYNREELPSLAVLRAGPWRAAEKFRRVSRKLKVTLRLAAATDSGKHAGVEQSLADFVTVTSNGIVRELLTFVEERLKHLDEKHIDMIRFVLQLCDRMVALDRENMDRCQREADSRGGIDAEKQQRRERLLRAERTLTNTETSIAEQGAPQVVKAIICRHDLRDALHAETLTLAVKLLERGNIVVQTLFRNVMAEDEKLVHAIRTLIHKAVDEARYRRTSRPDTNCPPLQQSLHCAVLLAARENTRLGTRLFKTSCIPTIQNQLRRLIVSLYFVERFASGRGSH